jgi:uncharacterized protein YjcR
MVSNSRKYRLLRKKWKVSELQWLRKNYRKFKYCDIATKLNRTTNSIRSIIIKKGWSKSKPRWLTKEELMLRKIYKREKSIKEASKFMKRTRFSVYCKARRLGILGN